MVMAHQGEKVFEIAFQIKQYFHILSDIGM